MTNRYEVKGTDEFFLHIQDNDKWPEDKGEGYIGDIWKTVDILNKQDQRIKELENTIKKLVIKLFQPPCIDNEDNDYEVLRKYLNEEYDINCTQIDIDVNNEKMLLKIEDETMPDNETDFKKKLEEIIGGSTGLEAAKKVAEYYRKNHRYDCYDYGPDGKPKRIRRKGEWKQ